MGTYKFRVLIDTKETEEIFRDILISKNDNFEVFYRTILDAFDFSGQELGSFYVSNENWDKGHEIALMDMQMSDGLESPSIMSDTLIEDMVHSEDQRFIMVYDFMRMWCFLIELIEETTLNLSSPEVSLSIGTAPSELSKDIDFDGMDDMDDLHDFGNDIDDIFSEFDDDDDEYGNMDFGDDEY